MTKLVNTFKKTLREGLKAVKKGAAIVAEKTPEMAAAMAEKTQEAVNVGRLRLEIQARNRKIEKHFGDLGKKVYGLSKEKASRIENSPVVKKYVNTVNTIKREIKGLEKKITDLKKTEQDKKKSKGAKPKVKPKAKSKPTPKTTPKATVKAKPRPKPKPKLVEEIPPGPPADNPDSSIPPSI